MLFLFNKYKNLTQTIKINNFKKKKYGFCFVSFSFRKQFFRVVLDFFSKHAIQNFTLSFNYFYINKFICSLFSLNYSGFFYKNFFFK